MENSIKYSKKIKSLHPEPIKSVHLENYFPTEQSRFVIRSFIMWVS